MNGRATKTTRIRCLHVVSALGGGGVERMLLNYVLHLDPSRYEFDFVVHGSTRGELEQDFARLGCRVFHVTPKRDSFFRNMRELNDIVRRGSYDVVHAHQNWSNVVPVVLAFAHRVPIRISHSHGQLPPRGWADNVARRLARLVTRVAANSFFACTTEAGKALHGKSWSPQQSDAFVMRNAIDLSRFAFDTQSRAAARDILGLGERPVILQVGRFSPEKNHVFTLRLLEQFSAPERPVLLLAGAGPEESAVRRFASERGLTPFVRFLGYRADVGDLMGAADVLVLPSESEGLGIVSIEAQAMGLPVVASLGVPREAGVTDLMEFHSLRDTELWVDALVRAFARSRNGRSGAISEAGYDAAAEARRFSGYLQDRIGMRPAGQGMRTN